MKIPVLIFTVLISMVVILSTTPEKANAQFLNVKPWHGYYPEMNDSYPLSFVAFKGWLFPVPHYFIRTWPTHYYLEVGALPVSDAAEYAGKTKTGLFRIAAKLLERSQMEGRHEETEGIKDKTQFRAVISQKLFDSRKDELPDIYRLADQFISLYGKIESFDRLENSNGVKHILQDDADDLLTRFLMVNLLESDHGAKLESFADIQSELNRLTGETDYTYRKLCYLDVSRDAITGSYTFLTR